MKRGFLKKIGAITVSAAMLASLGTTAFAAETLMIDNVNVADENGDGVYTVTVDYTASAAIETGVAMLAYAMKSGQSAIVGNTGSSADKPFDDATMEIVGVDQLSVEESQKTDGSISFNVTTNGNEGDLRMETGEVGILMLGGGNVDVPVGVYFAIPKAAVEATNATLDAESVNVTVAPGADIAAIKTAVSNAVKAMTATVTGSNEVGTVALANAVFADPTGSGTSYSVVVTIPEGTSTGNAYLTIPAGGLDFTVDFIVTEKTFAATGAKLNQAENTISLSERPADLGALNTAVETAIESIGVSVTGADGDSAAVPFENLTITGPESYTPSPDAQSVEYTVTIPQATEIAGVTFASDIEFTVNVNIPAEGAEGILGDIDGDQDVDWTDWGVLTNHLTTAVEDADLNDSSSAAYNAANINGDGAVDWTDWSLLTDHLTTAVPNEGIGQPF